jgi:hypothetical protein
MFSPHEAMAMLLAVLHAARRSPFDYPYQNFASSGRKEEGEVASKCSEMDNVKQQTRGDRSSLTNRSKNSDTGRKKHSATKGVRLSTTKVFILRSC